MLLCCIFSGINGKVHYSIIDNDVPFTIDASVGTVSTSRRLDREVISTYTLTVQAQDYAIDNPLSSTATVSICRYSVSGAGSGQLY